MWKTAEGSTGRLLQLCLAYFSLYTIFGVLTKAFTDRKHAVVLPAMSNMDFLIWSTVGGSVLCLAVLFFAGWHLADATRSLKVGPLRVPPEFAYIIPSGIFTAIIIPTTTLLYMLLKSVMVAMIIMRASVIVISRIVDEAQIRQGILKKTVYWEENVAVLFALAAASTQIFFDQGDRGELLTNALALGVLISYVISYGFRIYVMNYYKNTRPKGAMLDNRWFFGIEQITATFAMIAIATGFYVWASQTGAVLAFGTAKAAGEAAQAASILAAQPLVAFHSTIANPHTNYIPAIVAGMVYGGVAFFSVFIFMFKGRTATFATLVNRLTSLIAGTAATLLAFWLLGTRFPALADWSALALIFVAVGFLTLAERKRASELAKAKELEATVPQAADAAVAAEVAK